MKKISQLRFGNLDAKRYLDNPDDILSQQFKRSFLKSQHFSQVTNPEIYFLIGDKGMGKTSYAVYASNFHEGYSARTTVFTSSNFTAMKEVAKKVDISPAQYSTIWSFVLAINLVENLRTKLEVSGNHKFDAVIGGIRSCLLGGEAASIASCLELIEVSEALLEFLSGELSLDLSQTTISRASASLRLARITDICIDALASLPTDTQFTLFFDGLDVRPDEVTYKDFLEVISSICNAIWILNSSQFSKLPQILKTVLLLRPDMFENVTFQNRGPILQDHSHLIEWNTPYSRFEESEIFKLTDRILSCQQNQSQDRLETRLGETWRQYFPFKVKRHNSDEMDDPFILFLRHSFTKPRDIVKYLSLMQNMYQNDGLKNEVSFDERVFKDREIRADFSSYLNQEIRDQLGFYYTNNEYQSFLDFNSTHLNKKISKRNRVVNYENFVAAHKEYMHYNKTNNIAVPPSFETADLLLQFMFDLNVLAYYEERTLRDGQTKTFTNYSYKRRNFANLRPKIPTDGKYVMHYGVARALFVDVS